MSTKQLAEADMEWAEPAHDRGTLPTETYEAMKAAMDAGDYERVLAISGEFGRGRETDQS